MRDGEREARGRLRDHPATAALTFVAFLLLGCGYIVTAKLWGVRAGWVTFVPVAFMIAYASAMLFLDGLRLRDDQAGDNLYYMGFLYTLTSLGVSLYQFSASNASEGIVQNFGIAIASTIAGVAGRVLFNQMRRDPVEVERSARLELADSARKVRRELDATVVEMAFFRRQMQQMVQEGLVETKGRFDDAWTAVNDGLAQATSRTVEALDSHGQAVRGQGEAMANAQTGAIGALDKLRSRLDAARLPTDAVQPVTEALREAALELSRAVSAGRDLAPRMQAQVSELAGEVRRFEEAVDRQAARGAGAGTQQDNLVALRAVVDGKGAA